MTDVLPDPIPAATLVVFRAAVDGGAPELLIVERARTLVFAGGALVFPGGRVDPGDHAFAESLGGDLDDMAARVAAIRETIEEAGMPVGLLPLPDSRTLTQLRRALHGGADLGVALAETGIALDPAALIRFARWCPRRANMRIFDTRFFLAELPQGAPEPASRCDREHPGVLGKRRHSVGDVRPRRGARDLSDAPQPRTARAIRQLRRSRRRRARAGPIRIVTPWQEERDGAAHLCIPDDLGYPVTSELLERAIRG